MRITSDINRWNCACSMTIQLDQGIPAGKQTRIDFKHATGVVVGFNMCRKLYLGLYLRILS